jgi:hypothetical protein
MPIFKRTNCIITASGVVTLCKRLYSMPLTESDDTRCYDDTICPPEDGHVDARNISEDCNVSYILLMNKGIVH